MGLPFNAVGVHGNKGGVGKSTVGVNLALELHDRGYDVGFLDADIDSPFAAEILGIKDKVGLDEARAMVPVTHDGMKVMSFSAWAPSDMMGSTMRGQTHDTWIRDAIQETDWGGIDVLVVDFPAGSGDEFLSVRETLGDNLVGLVGVGMPNVESGIRRVYDNAAKHRLLILGVIENMTGDVFGQGGVETFCEETGLTFFGRIPLDKRIVQRHEQQNPRLPDDLMEPVENAADLVEGDALPEGS